MEENLILVALVMGLTEVAKRTGLRVRYLPLFAVIASVVMSGLYYGFSESSMMMGVVAGLSSMGLFSGTKATVKG
jgi:hypothetical protein